MLALIGLGITSYLSYEKLSGGEPTCVIGGGCATVQNSPYAELAGIPLSYLGVITYIILVASALIPGFPGRLIGFIVSLCGVAFSGWLLYAEIFLIKAICPYCVASLIVMVISLGVAITRMVRAGDFSDGDAGTAPA